MRRFSFLMLACLVLQPSCLQPVGCCSDVGCIDSLSVELEPPIVEEGTYEMMVATGNETYRCVANLPPPEEDRDACSSENGEAWHLYLDYSQAGELLGLELLSAPRRVEVTIRRDGVEIASDVLQPKYKKNQRDPACDGDNYCRNAEVVLHVR